MNEDLSSPTGEQQNSPRLLIVDDEPSVRELLERYFSQHGYSVITAENGAEALEKAKQHTVHLILVDFLLPDLDGVELVSKFKKIKSRRPVILMTGYGADDELSRKALDAGAADCVSKTSPLEQLRQRISELISPSQPPTGQRRHGTAEKTQPASSPSHGPSAPSSKLVSETAFSVQLACSILSASHPNLGSNATRASVLARTVGRVLSLNSFERLTLEQAAAWHDIALLGWERSLIHRWLQAPIKCTQEEITMIEKHPVQSALMLEFSDELGETRSIIQAHHEQWNGEGFPDRLEGEAIPWLARLLSVIVAYCNQTFPTPQSYSLIRKSAGTVFDPTAVDAIYRAVCVTEFPTTSRVAELGQITAGVQLAQDVLDNSGTLLLTKGTELTSAWVSRIAHVQSSWPSGILIFC